MNKLKAYVGLDGKFVLCEKFPDDEEHCGLHEMLEDFLGYDEYLTNDEIEQGFYELEFELNVSNYDYENDPYLVLTKYTKIKTLTEK